MNIVISFLLNLIGTGFTALLRILIFGSVLIGLVLYIMKFEISNFNDIYPINPSQWSDTVDNVQRLYNE